ncbi:hypothetical protein JCM3770_001771 [Rhodotorula araucariae]
MASTTQLSLEPLRPHAGDGHDADLFARPARLYDVVLEDGREVFTRDDPTQRLSERLMRVWAERGDYSQLSEERIRNPPQEQHNALEDQDPRPSVDDVRKLQETMLNSLALARGELSTALDLLSVLSTPRDPPDVDPSALPLPQQALTTVATVAPARSAPDPVLNPLAPLPLASSLGALGTAADAFFAASEALVPLDAAELAALATSPAPARRPRPRGKPSTPSGPDPWEAVLRLHAGAVGGGARTLVPLGAAKGASLAAGGAAETRAAREIGVFFGAQEAGPEWRRASVARVGELLREGAGERSGRRMVVELQIGETRERCVWDGERPAGGAEGDKVEAVLKARARAVFAEELFAQLTKESRTDSALRAELQLGGAKEGDAIAMTGSGWTLRISMTDAPEPATAQSSTATTIASLLRLLYLQEYSSRRSSTPTPSKRLLATISAFLSYHRRVHALGALLDRLRAAAETAGLRAAVDMAGSEQGTAADVLRVLDGEGVLGGRASLRVGAAHVFTVQHSSPLPSATPVAQGIPAAAATPTLLLLRVPGRAPVPIPSLRHLESFLGGEVEGACRVEKASQQATAEVDAA